MGAELLWGRHDDLLAGESHSRFGSLLDPGAVVGPRMVAGDVAACREERPGVTIGERRLSVTAPRTL